MKPKTIDRTIRTKIDEWLKSINDEGVRELARKNTIVTGGCIASMFLRERVNDFDVYFRTKEATVAVATYYLRRFMKENDSKFDDSEQCGDRLKAWIDDKEDNRVRIVIKSAGVLSATKTDGYKYFELTDPEDAETYVDQATEALENLPEDGDSFRPVFITQNAITLSNKVQIITRFVGSPGEIHKNYDYVHCTNYWTPQDGLVTNKEALECLLSKELRYVGSLYPFCSVVRMRKFIKRDWTINAGQILKMTFQISKLDLEDMNVLEDQLIGVDIAYFLEIVTLLKKKSEEEGKPIDSSYLMEIVDRIF